MGAALGAGAAACLLHAGVTWLRYGRVLHSGRSDELLDRFMPVFDVATSHRIRVAAPASTAFTTALNIALCDLPLVSALFQARELFLGASGAKRQTRNGLLAEMRALGWVVLAEHPGEVIAGAATRPWEADVVFRSVTAEEFANFREPDYIRIVWTIRVERIGKRASVLRTDTRAVATSPSARSKFRLYWSLACPGIFLIRRLMLGAVKREAERAMLSNPHPIAGAYVPEPTASAIGFDKH